MLSCENVSVKYEAGYGIRDVSFKLFLGDYLCIVGENGTGKSTLMKSILGLVKPTEGKISFSGLSRSHIGYLPQQSSIQKDFPASVYEVILSGRLNRYGVIAFYSAKDKQKVMENAKILGIESLLKKSYRELSGGQQQRVLLARALCATDRLLMLDEPAAGLDPIMSGELYKLLSSLNNRGITIIMISHDINAAVKYGNKILHMGSSPLFFGSSSDYVRSKLGRQMVGGDFND